MGLTGSGIGLLMAAVAVRWLGPVVAAAVGLEAAVGLTASAAAQGAGIGLLVALAVRAGPAAGGPTRAPVAPAARVGARAASTRRGVVLLRVRHRRAAGGAGGLAGRVVEGRGPSWPAVSRECPAVLVGAGVLLVRSTRPLQRSRRLAVRYASRRVGRPGQPGAAGAAGRGHRGVSGSGRAPAAGRPAAGDGGHHAARVAGPVPDRRAARPGRQVCARFSGRSSPGAEPVLIPVLRARITAIRGRETTLDSYEDVRGRGGGLGREYVVTYRPAPRATTSGSSPASSGPPRLRPGRRCRSRKASRSGSGSTIGDVITVRHPRPGGRGDGGEHSRGGLVRCARRRLHVRVPARRARVGSGHVHLAREGAARGSRPGAVPARPDSPIRERLRHRRPRDPRGRDARAPQRVAGGHHRRVAGPAERYPDPGRVHFDDPVPAQSTRRRS